MLDWRYHGSRRSGGLQKRRNENRLEGVGSGINSEVSNAI